jgi:hypothetical protein
MVGIPIYLSDFSLTSSFLLVSNLRNSGLTMTHWVQFTFNTYTSSTMQVILGKTLD